MCEFNNKQFVIVKYGYLIMYKDTHLQIYRKGLLMIILMLFYIGNGFYLDQNWWDVYIYTILECVMFMVLSCCLLEITIQRGSRHGLCMLWWRCDSVLASGVKDPELSLICSSYDCAVLDKAFLYSILPLSLFICVHIDSTLEDDRICYS